jgi:hypothetical protein
MRVSWKIVVTLSIVLFCIIPPIYAAVQTVTVTVVGPLQIRVDWTEEEGVNQ